MFNKISKSLSLFRLTIIGSDTRDSFKLIGQPSKKELELSAFGLQLQSKASEDTHHKREEEISFWKRVSFVQRNTATYQVSSRLACTISFG